ncbi:anthranilate phosphoribosyltransferase [Halochromatium salexigens]|uniref:Anthranilate phosphoribosyltransferase n=1 Tax=Halochromatium salexigens TaxID=49447 RepID=A0AAJ0UH48_HALSE|nr:anthranilate phosphoribosyltransferase [Halochromatium salexigens]MBK5930457.1 anthranilate phosphoribosyltransferase [Halochromatium salexigens]
MSIKQAIARVVDGHDLDDEMMTATMNAIMTGEATPAQVAGFLVALRLKGETVTEITAAAQVMRGLATGVDLAGLAPTVDIVGTGGDASGTFNVSTTSIFVAAAAGCHVAKHGNRSVSSKSGAADVLEAAGLRLDLGPQQVARCVREVGVGFMFAPAHHGAMKHAIGPRRELGIRSIFNVLGPLTNPAGVRHQVLGVFSEALLMPLAEVLQRLGSTHVLVVHARDGLDEISVAERTEIAELKEGVISRYSLAPEDVGLKRSSLEAIRVENPAQSLALLMEVLDDQPGAARDIVVLNAGAAIYAADVADSLADGVRLADAVIASGAARQRFDALIALANSL